MGGYSDLTESDITDGLAYASGMGGVAASNPAPEGSADWWNYEIQARENAAVLNTADNPTASEWTNTGTGFYQDPRTGDMYASYAQFVAATSPGGSAYVEPTKGTHTVITPNGTPFDTTYSQYWMDPNYRGSEPEIAEKAYYSSAEYAAANAYYIMDRAQGIPTNKIQPPPTYAQSKLIQPAAAQTNSGLPTEAQNLLDRATSTGYQLMGWLEQNFLLVVIGLAAIFVLPRLLPSRSRG
jgi:hypothetical protein